jgi:hypothetical protein
MHLAGYTWGMISIDYRVRVFRGKHVPFQMTWRGAVFLSHMQRTNHVKKQIPDKQ